MGLWDAIVGLFGGGGGGDAASSFSVGDWLPQTTPDVSSLPAAPTGGFDFSPVADQSFAQAAPAMFSAPNVSEAGGSFGNVARSIGDALYTAPTEKGGAPGGFVGGLANVAKAALPVASLAAGGLGIANALQGQGQQAKMTRIAERGATRADEISRAQQANAAPLQSFAASRMAAAETGTLPPGEEERIQSYIRGARARMRQQMASRGQGSSEEMDRIEEVLNSLEVQMRGAALRDLQNQGINASGVAGNMLAGATGSTQAGSQIAVNQQGSLQKLIEDAQRMMGQLGAA